MTRRSLLRFFGLMPVAAFVGCADAKESAAAVAVPSKLKPADWEKLLPAAAYGVLFEENTERPGTSPLNHEKRDGVYVCAACYNPLFNATDKYDSGTGWPSFSRPRDGSALGTKVDNSFFSQRTEYHCAHCGGHQGHVFDDGPKPTGLRYCNNGVALNFIPKGDALPALRG